MTTNRGVNPNSGEHIIRSEELESIVKGVVAEHGVQLRHLAPYVVRSVVLRCGDGVEGVVLKGIDSLGARESFERGLIEGAVPNFGGEQRSRDAVISSELASEMGVEVGERLELLATDSSGAMRRDLYRVGAIYTAGLGSAEKFIVITDMRNVQRLNRWSEGQISGYDIGVSEAESSLDIAEEINNAILYSPSEGSILGTAFAVEQLYPAVFDWLSALDVNAVVVISIMMIVAIFNIITAILIIVLERMQMIGVLKTLGMDNRSIGRIFLYRALNITLKALLWGNAIGVGLALLQHNFHILKLDEAGYLLSSVPIEMNLYWLVALNVGVVVIILLSVTLPTRIVSAIEPHKAIKFQ